MLVQNAVIGDSCLVVEVRSIRDEAISRRAAGGVLIAKGNGPMIRLSILLTALSCVSVFAQDAGTPDQKVGKFPGDTGPQWTVGSVSVSKPAPDAEFTPSLQDRVGSHCVAYLQLPKRFLIGIDETRSSIESFTDNFGKDLLKELGERGVLRPQTINSTEVAKSGKYAKVEFNAPLPPSAKATKIHIKGTVAAVYGKEEKTVEIQNASLKKKNDFELGTIGKSDNNFAFSTTSSLLTYRGNRPLKHVVFLDENGDEISYRTSSRSAFQSRTAAKGQFGATFSIMDRKADRCTIRVTYFDSYDMMAIPVELEIGLGF